MTTNFGDQIIATTTVDENLDALSGVEITPYSKHWQHVPGEDITIQWWLKSLPSALVDKSRALLNLRIYRHNITSRWLVLCEL